MKSTAKQNWFDDLINDFVPNVPTCPQLSPQPRGQSKATETRMDKGHDNSVPVVPTVPTRKNNSEKFFSITRRQEETIRNWLIEIDEPEADHYLVLSKCKRDSEALIYYLGLAAEHARMKRREKVLKMLADNPGIMRAFITDAESDQDHVIIALAIRDAGTCELLIPRDKYDAFAVLEVIKKASIQ